jgi:hypothetical protein
MMPHDGKEKISQNHEQVKGLYWFFPGRIPVLGQTDSRLSNTSIYNTCKIKESQLW